METLTAGWRAAIACAALCVAVASPSPARAQGGLPRAAGAGLTLQVRDPAGHGIAGAEAALRRQGGGEIRQTTNAEGIARFAALPVGDYELRVDAPGFTGETRRVQIRRGELSAVEITVERVSASPGTPGPLPKPSAPASEPVFRPGLPTRREPAGPGGATEGGAPAPAPDEKVFVPVPDRWNIGLPDWDRYGGRGDYPYVAGHWWDPYNRNTLKGDYPAFARRRTFFVFTGVSDTLLEGRTVPTATTPSSARPLGEAFFGRGDQYLPVGVVRTSLDLFRGDTAFRPVDWRVRVQPAFSVNYLRLQETGGVNRDVRAGTTRLDSHVALQEAFVEKKLFDLSPNYDFVSVRAGIQELSTDFRGFIAVVEQPGVRVFGTLASSRVEYNAAIFDFLEKDTNSGFNELRRRHQQMVVANAYIQDFLTPGYTTELSFLFNRDQGTTHYDANGFLVRPAPIGLVAPHEIRAYYVGWAGNGHIRRLNVSHAIYQALGADDLNPIAGRAVRINAQMAALELSLDRDWLRFRGSFFFASGDGNIGDNRARGFDAIVDAPVFAGGAISLWDREGLPLSQTGTGLLSPLSLLPSLRTNKDEGQANFVNPGIFIVSGGVDAELTPTLRTFTNVSGLWFDQTQPLTALLFQAPIDRSVGIDFGGGAQYRPALSENIVVTGGAAAMRLGQGLRAIYSRDWFVAIFANLRVQF
jgi:hypothetical protein